MKRESVYKGLFDWVTHCLGDKLITSSRQLRHWNDVDPAEQPALFMAQAGESNITNAVPQAWEMDVELYLYCNSSGDPDIAAATQMNELLDAITEALQPKFPGWPFDLDGLVHDVRINGKIETDAGLLGPQSVAIVPIKIIVEN